MSDHSQLYEFIDRALVDLDDIGGTGDLADYLARALGPHVILRTDMNDNRPRYAGVHRERGAAE